MAFDIITVIESLSTKGTISVHLNMLFDIIYKWRIKRYNVHEW